jgi:hypothetical protein
MHCRELVELAAIVATEEAERLNRGCSFDAAIEQYWSASKARLDNWSKACRGYLRLQISAPPAVAADGLFIMAWQEARPIIEEILVAEILTRIWTAAVSLGNDRRDCSWQPIVRSVFTGHLTARNRALNVLVYGRGFSAREASELNALRRRCERWTDLLLSYLVDARSAAPSRIYEFAFEPDRTHEFAKDLADDKEDRSKPLPAEMLQASLRAAFAKGLEHDSPQARLNQQIANSIIACFSSAQRAESSRGPASWLDRISRVTADTQAMIEDLLSLEGHPRGVSSH